MKIFTIGFLILISAFGVEARGEVSGNDLFKFIDKVDSANLRFAPVGFSPDGKFAFLQWTANWGCADCIRLEVVDLVTDKSVGSWGMDNYDPTPATFREAVGNYVPDILKLLNEHRITLISNLREQPFPLRFNNQIFEARIDKVVIEERNDRGEFMEKIKLNLESVGKGSKELVELQRGLDSEPNMDKIDGYFMSPYEKRIVVKTSGRKYIGEGDWENHIGLFGAHLNVGFKKAETANQQGDAAQPAAAPDASRR